MKRNRIEELFVEAMEVPPGERRSVFLDQHCQGDAALRERVERLLKAHQEAGNFLTDDAAATIQQDACECRGAEIGAYKVLEPLGEGGFGIVYVAEQAEPVRRKVALKVIKPGMDTREVIARFEAERQALAIMDHPHIARVFDGGATRQGRPYFVMELVDGAPISQFCDELQLCTRERLTLFIRVCQAVHHAHQKGVIHRDIKPSNVLVTLHDSVPTPKIIDFGIAKALNQRLTEHSLYTQVAQVVGTPLYMSPEQADRSGLDIDTRSDIYSLGVLLYELLTGTTPYDRESMKRISIDELRRMVREVEAPSPSARVSTLADEERSTVCERRKVDARKFVQSLRGDLDLIVMKCLEKDRTRRYESAAALAADVQRHLDAEPVEACPPSTLYRVRKLLQRRRGSVIAVSGVALVLVLLAAGIGWVVSDQAARQAKIEYAARQAMEDSRRFQRQRSWAEALAAGMRAKDLLDATRTPTPLLREVEQRIRDLELIAELEHIQFDRSNSAAIDPKSNLVVQDSETSDAAFADAFHSIGVDFGDLSAEEAAERIRATTVPGALALALDTWATQRKLMEKPEPYDWKDLIATARRVDSDPHRNKLRAIWLAGERSAVVEFAKSVPVSELPPPTIRALGNVLINLEAAEEAVELLRKGWQLHPDEFTLVLGLEYAMDVARRDDHERRLPFLIAAHALRPESALIQFRLGLAYGRLARYEEANFYYRRMIELQPDAIAAVINLSVNLRRAKKWDESIALCQETIQRRPDAPQTYRELGRAYAQQGRFGEALEAIGGALEATDVKTDLARTQQLIADVLVAQKKLEEGGQTHLKAAALCREAIDEDASNAHAHYLLGLSLQSMGRLDEAEQAMRAAIAREPMSEEAYNWHRELGNTYQLQSKYDLALKEFLKAIEFRGNAPDLHRIVAELMSQDPQATYFDPNKSLQHARKALDLDSEWGLAWRALGWAKYRQGDAQACIEALEKSMKLLDDGDSRHWLFMAMACWKIGQRDEAREWYERAAQAVPKERTPWGSEQDLYDLRNEAAALLGTSAAADEAP